MKISQATSRSLISRNTLELEMNPRGNIRRKQELYINHVTLDNN